MHEENFWSSWPREDERGKGERMAKTEKKKKKRVKRGKEKRRKKTVKRGCEGLVSVEAFEIFSQGGDVESFGDLRGRIPWRSLMNCQSVGLFLVR